MSYTRHFKPGQKILLRAIATPSSAQIDALTVYFKECGKGFFDLSLPYRSKEEESYPFDPETNYEILSDSLGLGIRLKGRFQQQLDHDTIRVEITTDLEIFQRRLSRRIDTTIGLRYTKGRGQIRTFRTQWEKNVQILQKGVDASKLPSFQKIQVNLSAGGIRFDIKKPIDMADICMLFLQLEEDTPPICAMAEIVWLGESESGERQTAGMQFLNMLEADQKKIESFIKTKLTYLQPSKKDATG